LTNLRNSRYIFRGGDPLHHSLAQTVDVIIDKITHTNGASYNITSYREQHFHGYEDYLDHNKTKKLKIRKEDKFTRFRDPYIGKIPNTSRLQISI
jgi:hypothetical protein